MKVYLSVDEIALKRVHQEKTTRRPNNKDREFITQ